MRRQGIWLLALLLLAGLAQAAWAQDAEEAKAAPAPTAPTFMYVWTDHVAVADMAAYEAEVKKVMAMMAETEEAKKLMYFALNAGGAYHFVIPMAELGEFMQKNQEFMAATMAAGGMEIWDASQKLVTHGSGQLIVARPDLSYTPAEPREAETSGMYRQHEWWYVKPGWEMEIEGVAKKIAKLYADKGAETGFRIYQAMTGDDLPMYLVTFSAADAADHYANEKALDEMLGEEVQKLMQEAAGYARRVERTSAMMRPDLSMGM